MTESGETRDNDGTIRTAIPLQCNGGDSFKASRAASHELWTIVYERRSLIQFRVNKFSIASKLDLPSVR